MKIIVCVKQVLDTAAQIQIENGKVVSPGSSRIINPYDEFAVEEAVRIKEKKPDTEITLLSLGPEGFRDSIKKALAMGADKAVHLVDDKFDELDSYSLARVLACAIEKVPYDLILCGRQAVDMDRAQTGPALATFLNIPFVTVVTGIDFNEDFKKAKITRQVEGGSEIRELPLPLLLTCQKGLNEPRLPSLKGIMAAKKKEVSTLSASELDIESLDIGDKRVIEENLSLPPERKKGIILQGTDEEISGELARLL
ncbi:MAG: electron transfer flavoprotein subunit beta/FixA family protein, partial [Nitrospinae bacterium]|nr:electron transfer flavoprotein subunit beta/FixA family protein [Nitrospinota bacterium]